jgi:hypothetical protein
LVHRYPRSLVTTEPINNTNSNNNNGVVDALANAVEHQLDLNEKTTTTTTTNTSAGLVRQ